MTAAAMRRLVIRADPCPTAIIVMGPHMPAEDATHATTALKPSPSGSTATRASLPPRGWPPPVAMDAGPLRVRRLRDAGADPEAQRRVVPPDRQTERRCVGGAAAAPPASLPRRPLAQASGTYDWGRRRFHKPPGVIEVPFGAGGGGSAGEWTIRGLGRAGCA